MKIIKERPSRKIVSATKFTWPDKSISLIITTDRAARSIRITGAKYIEIFASFSGYSYRILSGRLDRNMVEEALAIAVEINKDAQ